MDSLYTWIDANVDRLKYFLSANFLVLSVVLVMARVFDGGLVFSVVSFFSAFLCGYSMMCGALVMMQYRNLKVRVSHIAHFGSYKFDPELSNRDQLAAMAFSEFSDGSHPLMKTISIVFGLRFDDFSFAQMTFEDFELRIEGAEVRSILATVFGVCLFSCAVLLFIIGTLS